MTEDEIRILDAKWKSDIDKKVDRLLSFHEVYGPLMVMLHEREKDAKELRKAIIHKGITALVVTGITALGALIWSGAKAELSGLIELLKPGK